MTAPTPDALRMAEIQAMRSLADSLAQLTRTVEGLSADMRQVRDDITMLKAQELKAAIIEARNEFISQVRELRADHEKDVAEVRGQAQANAVAIARLRGVFLPLATVASALAAGLLSFLSQLAAETLGRR